MEKGFKAYVHKYPTYILTLSSHGDHKVKDYNLDILTYVDEIAKEHILCYGFPW